MPRERQPGDLIMKQVLLAACCAAALCGGTANAAIIPVLDSIMPVGPLFEFTYSGTLASDAGVIPGSQLVIYDFAGCKRGSDSGGIARI